MKIALAYNAKTRDVEAEQEFDAPHHVRALAKAIRGLGHTLWLCEVSASVRRWMPRMLRYAPDLVLNIAEGRTGRSREAVFPALFEAYDLPYTGSDPWALAVTLDKELTKNYLPTRLPRTCALPWSKLVRTGSHELHAVPRPRTSLHIVKPNHEGSSKGITDASCVPWSRVGVVVDKLLHKYPEGVLVEQFVEGRDVTVSWTHDLGVLPPVTLEATTPRARSLRRIYGYAQKGLLAHEMRHREIQVDGALLAAERVVHAFGLRDVARVDFRLDAEGTLWFLEVNALPSLEYDGALATSAALVGWSYAQVIDAIIESARRRHRLVG